MWPSKAQLGFPKSAMVSKLLCGRRRKWRDTDDARGNFGRDWRAAAAVEHRAVAVPAAAASARSAELRPHPRRRLRPHPRRSHPRRHLRLHPCRRRLRLRSRSASPSAASVRFMLLVRNGTSTTQQVSYVHISHFILVFVCT